jgi:C4-dicarboxylate-binding protein DctP
MTPTPHLRRHLLAVATAALVAALPLAAQAQAAAPIVIKFSHVVTPDTPKGKGADRFKQLAEERTKGRVKVEVYPNSQLYKDKEELEALALGSVQMLAPSLAKFGPMGVKEFEVFDLPFLFRDTPSFRAVTEGPAGKALMDKLEPKGFIGLAYWDNGFSMMSANKPLHRVADFKGLKMRIQSSKVIDAYMRSLGAIPQVMAFSELYQALQSGVVDGTENTASNLYTQKVYEVQKHFTVSNHGHISYAVVVNKTFWRGLPADIRSTLEGAMRDATTYANAIAEVENLQALDKIRASGKSTVYTLTAEETAEWRKAMYVVHQDMADRVGKSTIQLVYKASGFVPPK